MYTTHKFPELINSPLDAQLGLSQNRENSSLTFFLLPPPVPGPPMGILFPEVRTTSVRLIWQPPAAPNGIILGKSALPVPFLGKRRWHGGRKKKE